MPDRMIREGIINSEKVNQLSWGAEVFFRRLLNKIDDYARYDGRPGILRAHLYPLQLDKVSEPDIAKWIAESREAGLVRQYTVEGKPYLLVENFGQRIRAEKSKWPAPDNACQHLTAAAAESEDVNGSENESGKSRADASLGEIPTLEEVVDYGRGSAGIDPEFCRHYHAKKTETHGWVKNGRLVLWRHELVRWWASDRESWMAKKSNKGRGKPKGPNI